MPRCDAGHKRLIKQYGAKALLVWIIALGLVLPPDHPLAGRQSRRLADSVGHRMILPAEPLALAAPVTALRMATGVPCDVACALDNVEMITSLVRGGIGILTALDVTEEVSEGRLSFAIRRSAR